MGPSILLSSRTPSRTFLSNGKTLNSGSFSKTFRMLSNKTIPRGRVGQNYVCFLVRWVVFFKKCNHFITFFWNLPNVYLSDIKWVWLSKAEKKICGRKLVTTLYIQPSYAQHSKKYKKKSATNKLKKNGFHQTCLIIKQTADWRNVPFILYSHVHPFSDGWRWHGMLKDLMFLKFCKNFARTSLLEMMKRYTIFFYRSDPAFPP